MEGVNANSVRLTCTSMPTESFMAKVEFKHYINLVVVIVLLREFYQIFGKSGLGELELNLLTPACRHLNKHIGEEISW